MPKGAAHPFRSAVPDSLSGVLATVVIGTVRGRPPATRWRDSVTVRWALGKAPPPGQGRGTSGGDALPGETRRV